MTRKTSKAAPRQAVVILGMHRSGTSALTGTLALLGCGMPKTMMPPQPDNPKGFFESRAVAKLNDEILAAAGSHWSDWKSTEAWIAGEGCDAFRDRARTMLDDEFGAVPVFAMKDPRLCLTFPVWQAALKDAGIGVAAILTQRNPVEVARSLELRNGFPPMKALLLWLRYVLESERATRKVLRVVTSYDRLMQGGVREVARIAAVLESPFPNTAANKQAEIDALIAPELRHFDLQAEGGDPIVPHAWVTECQEVLNRWAEEGEATKDRRVLDRLRKAFDTAAPAFHALIEESDEAGAVARSVVGTAKVVELERRLENAETQANAAQMARDDALRRAETWRERVEGEEGLAAKLHQARDRIAALEQDPAGYGGGTGQTAALEAEHAAAVEARDVAHEKMSALQAVQDVHRKELKAARKELDTVRSSLTEKDARLQESWRELALLARQIGEASEQLKVAQAEAESLKELNTALDSALQAARDTYDHLTGELDAARAELQRLQSTLQYSEAEVAAMRNSTSWRVTRPMRALTKRLRRRPT